MAKFYVFLLVGVATGIWYTMYQEPTESSDLDLNQESFLAEMNDRGKDRIRNMVHETSRVYFKDIETVTCQNERTDDPGWATPPEIVAKVDNKTTEMAAWGCGRYRVSVLQSENELNMICWNKGDDFVVIIEYSDRLVCQTWVLGGATISVSWNPEDGKFFECWMMEKATVAYREKDGNVIYRWADAKKDVPTFLAYRRKMFSWCEQNGEWIERQRLPCFLHRLKDEDIY